MSALPDLLERKIAAFVREFEALSAKEADPMGAYHHANYALSALASILAEQIDLEVNDAVAGIIDQYEEIAKRAEVDFSLYDEYEV